MNAAPYMPQPGATNWATPRHVFEPLDREFHFTLDVCAEPWNTKCPSYFTEADDGLSQPWTVAAASGAAWCNPPYGARNITKWLVKAIEESRARLVTTVLLLPSTTDVKWFHDYVWNEDARSFYPWAECRFVKGRILFDPPPGYTGKHPGNVKGSLIVIIRPV